MIAENHCLHATTTTRTVPIEISSPSGTVNVVPHAAWHTCTQCEASFYTDETLAHMGYPVSSPAATPAALETWDC